MHCSGVGRRHSQIGETAHLQTPSRDGVEDNSCDEAEGGQKNQARRQNGGRLARHEAGLDESYDQRNGEA